MDDNLKEVLQDMLAYMKGHTHNIVPDSNEQTGSTGGNDWAQLDAKFHTNYKNISADDIKESIENLLWSDDIENKLDLALKTQLFMLQELTEIKRILDENKTDT